jgi:hypothetical protein
VSDAPVARIFNPGRTADADAHPSRMSASSACLQYSQHSGHRALVVLGPEELGCKAQKKGVLIRNFALIT